MLFSFLVIDFLHMYGLQEQFINHIQQPMFGQSVYCIAHCQFFLFFGSVLTSQVSMQMF